ncbi:putative reverse transcriptase domain-containing protein [Tanacetum coccineum]|uniref:Reverse transcriptase domain-containing protein n=1 Tax=Tanacetum coccineum TaxID=301880 RepID=A0ABQ5A067_9ASTR
MIQPEPEGFTQGYPLDSVEVLRSILTDSKEQIKMEMERRSVKVKELQERCIITAFKLSNQESYHASVRCALFEALYGRKCRSLIMWTEVGEGQLIGPELVQETIEKISQIKDRLKVVHDHQKSYADKRRKPLEFSVGDYVLLKVSPWKGYGTQVRTERIVMHLVPLDEIRVDAKLNFVEESVEILEREFKSLKRSWIAIVKVRWNSKRGPEFTWEREDQMKLKAGRYIAPEFFRNEDYDTKVDVFSLALILQEVPMATNDLDVIGKNIRCVVLRAGFIYGKRKVGEYEIPLHLIGEPFQRLLNAAASFTKPSSSLPASALILAHLVCVDDVALAAINAVKDDDCFGVFTIDQIKEVAARVLVFFSGLRSSHVQVEHERVDEISIDYGGWLGKNSTMEKNYNLLQDAHAHLLSSLQFNFNRNIYPTREVVDELNSNGSTIVKKVQELHRLNKRQRGLMNELTRKEHCNAIMLTEAPKSSHFLSQVLSKKVIDLELSAAANRNNVEIQPVQDVHSLADLNKPIQVEEASFAASIIINNSSQCGKKNGSLLIKAYSHRRDLQSELLIERYKLLKSAAEKLKLRSKGDMKVEAKSSSLDSCGKFIEVVIILEVTIASYMVTTALQQLILLEKIIRTLLMVDSITFGREMVNILVSRGAYDKVFNHLHAPLEEKAETESNIWDDGSEDVNPFGGGNPRAQNTIQEEPIVLVKEESCPVYDTDNEEKESMPVYDTDIEDVMRGIRIFGGIEDNIEERC